MKEGDLYPELRHITYTKTYATIREIKSVSSGNWMNIVQKTDTENEVSFNVDNLKMIRIDIPIRDWERIMEIYKSHYHAIERNPAVESVWQQYKMLKVLAR